MRLGKIGDSECYNCYLYNVTATLTGMFFAVVNDGKSQAGYGHAGCCHLLAIERVEDVAAVRTAVRAGASFKCTHESKDLTQEDAERLRSISTSCKGISRQACHEMPFRQMAAVAMLWGDTLDADAGFLDGRLIYEHTEESGWRTSDRSKFYKLFIQSENPLEDGSSVLSGKVSRVICTVVTPPIPQAANMSCREYSKKLKSMPSDSKRKSKPSDWGEDLTKNPQEIRNLEDASAGMFEQAAKELGISIEPGMKPASCEAPLVFGGKEIGSCSWVNETGTMRIGISLMRTWPLKKNDKQGASSWVLTSAGADVCEVEK